MQQLAQQLILKIPHLSDKKREYWLGRIPFMDDLELKELIKVLQEENRNFNTVLASELKEEDFDEAAQLMSQASLKVSQEQEAIEKEKEEEELEQIIKNI